MARRKSLRKRRQRHRFRRRTKPGAAPGTLVSATGAPPPKIDYYQYNREAISEGELESATQIGSVLNDHKVTWINVVGVQDAEAIAEIGRQLGLHPLALEDVMHVHQRAKVEEYEKHLFMVGRMLQAESFPLHENSPPADFRILEDEQLSIFLGPSYVLTFQERTGDCFEPLRQRLRDRRTPLRQHGAEYLAYSILDTLIDSYFPIIEAFGDCLETLDDMVARSVESQVMQHLHELRAELQILRRVLRPMRDMMHRITIESPTWFSSVTALYLRDCYDHTIQQLDMLQMYREQCTDVRDFHLSQVSSRLNEIMRVLTIISTLFIPLSFIAGLYGMNFNSEKSIWNMPELNWKFGYLGAILLMFSIAIGQMAFFWRKGWLGDNSARMSRSVDSRASDD